MSAVPRQQIHVSSISIVVELISIAQSPDRTTYQKSAEFADFLDLAHHWRNG
jgi:hypothetical protein